MEIVLMPFNLDWATKEARYLSNVRLWNYNNGPKNALEINLKKEQYEP